MKYVLTIIASIILFGLGFYLGQKMDRTFTGYRYVQGEEQQVNVDIPKPEETIPEHPVLPLRIDTVCTFSVEYVYHSVDTVAIIEEYITKRKYTIPLFDNKDSGRLTLDATIQYNKLTDMQYNFIPVYKEIIYKDKKAFEPFLSASYSTMDILGIGGGAFINKVGLEYQFQHNYLLNSNGHLFSLKYRF